MRGSRTVKPNFNNRNQKVVALQWGRETELIGRGTTAELSNVSSSPVTINFGSQPTLDMGQFLIGVC